MRFISVVCCVLMGLCAGCGMTALNDQGQSDRQDSTVVVAPTSADVWSALAQAVENKTIETRRELAQYVKSLFDNGDLSQSALADFNSNFSGATTDESKLSASDVALLRSMK